METKDFKPRGPSENIHHRLVRDTELRFSVIAEPYNREAYRLYLEGRFHWEQWTVFSVRKALQNFRDAIVVSPQYAEAYGWLSICYIYLGMKGAMPSWQAFEKAERILREARRLNASLGVLWAAQALVETFLHRDYANASDAFEQAIDATGRSCIHHFYALFLLAVGKPKPAIECLEAALESDPDHLLYNSELGRAYYYNRQYAEALEQFDYVLDLDADFQAAYTGKGWTCVAMDRLNEAHAAFHTYQNMVSHHQRNVPHLVYLAARLGMRDIALHFLNELQTGADHSAEKVKSLDLALIHHALGNTDEVFYHLQWAVDDQVGDVVALKTDPVWDELKSDIRYKRLLRQMNLINTEYILPVFTD